MTKTRLQQSAAFSQEADAFFSKKNETRRGRPRRHRAERLPADMETSRSRTYDEAWHDAFAPVALPSGVTHEEASAVALEHARRILGMRSDDAALAAVILDLAVDGRIIRMPRRVLLSVLTDEAARRGHRCGVRTAGGLRAFEKRLADYGIAFRVDGLTMSTDGRVVVVDGGRRGAASHNGLDIAPVYARYAEYKAALAAAGAEREMLTLAADDRAELRSQVLTAVRALFGVAQTLPDRSAGAALRARAEAFSARRAALWTEGSVSDLNGLLTDIRAAAPVRARAVGERGAFEGRRAVGEAVAVAEGVFRRSGGEGVAIADGVAEDGVARGRKRRVGGAEGGVESGVLGGAEGGVEGGAEGGDADRAPRRAWRPRGIPAAVATGAGSRALLTVCRPLAAHVADISEINSAADLTPAARALISAWTNPAAVDGKPLDEKRLARVRAKLLALTDIRNGVKGDAAGDVAVGVNAAQDAVEGAQEGVQAAFVLAVATASMASLGRLKRHRESLALAVYDHIIAGSFDERRFPTAAFYAALSEQDGIGTDGVTDGVADGGEVADRGGKNGGAPGVRASVRASVPSTASVTVLAEVRERRAAVMDNAGSVTGAGAVITGAGAVNATASVETTATATSDTTATTDVTVTDDAAERAAESKRQWEAMLADFASRPSPYAEHMAEVLREREEFLDGIMEIVREKMLEGLADGSL